MVMIIPVADTTPDIPRFSANVNYQGRADRSFEVDIVCPTWDTEPTSTEVMVEVQQSFDDGATWEDFAILSTNAGRRGRTGNMPTMTCQVVDGLGARVARAKLTVSAPITLGVNGTVV